MVNVDMVDIVELTVLGAEFEETKGVMGRTWLAEGRRWALWFNT